MHILILETMNVTLKRACSPVRKNSTLVRELLLAAPSREREKHRNLGQVLQIL